MTDHYAALGITNRKCTQERILARYLDIVKVHHPDKGGDPEEFKKVAEAFRILHDPVSREHYDLTGEDPKPDPSFTHILQVVSSTMVDMIKECIQQGVRPEEHDFIVMMRKGLDARIQFMEKGINEKKMIQSSLKKMRKKFKTKKKQVEDNHLQKMVDYHLDLVAKSLAAYIEDLKWVKKAHDFLADYTWEDLQSMWTRGTATVSFGGVNLDVRNLE